MSKSSFYITGIANWAKVLGPPVQNYSKDGYEWTIDITPDDDSVAVLNNAGIGDRMKNKGDDRGEFISFRQKATRMNGEENDPIRVVDAKNRPWDPKELIGNGSKVQLKFNVKDYGPGKKQGVYPQAIRVLELVSYAPVDFEPLPEDSEYVKAADEKPHVAPDFDKDFGLDDDLNDDMPTDA